MLRWWQCLGGVCLSGSGSSMPFLTVVYLIAPKNGQKLTRFNKTLNKIRQTLAATQTHVPPSTHCRFSSTSHQTSYSPDPHLPRTSLAKHFVPTSIRTGASSPQSWPNGFWGSAGRGLIGMWKPPSLRGNIACCSMWEEATPSPNLFNRSYQDLQTTEDSVHLLVGSGAAWRPITAKRKWWLRTFKMAQRHHAPRQIKGICE